MELILFRHIYAVKKFSKLFGDIISNDKKEYKQSDYIDFDGNTIPYYNNKGISIENDIEVYDRNKKHLGSMNPVTGEMYKPAEKGRTLTK